MQETLGPSPKDNGDFDKPEKQSDSSQEERGFLDEETRKKEIAEYEKKKEEYDLACNEAEKHAFSEPLSEEGKFFMERVVDSYKRGGEKSWEERHELYKDILSRLYGTADDKNRGFGQMPGIAYKAKGWIEAAGKFMDENREYDIISGDPIGDIKRRNLTLTEEQKGERKNFNYTRKVFRNITRDIVKERLPAEDKDNIVM